ncbi:alcohol dehydrogenase catalytic domain-containing protein [Nocardia sp. NPDC056541]|uniref:alcohol dehydrogenase catalytic domain-containing protein n=1 Tax=Nocardia sp. NPDC056541 TaxID=3345860 RepID=UPI00366FC3A0
MKIRGAVLEQVGADTPFSQSRPLRVCELDLADPRDNEVLVRVEAAGVCHSDLSVLTGSRPRPLPMLLGHEAAGSVLRVGARVEDIEPGTRVVMTFLPRCRDCAACDTAGRVPCPAGSAANAEGIMLDGGRRLTRDGSTVHHHLGVSAFATHVVVDRRSVVPVGDDVPAEVAAVLGCAVLTGGGAVLNVRAPVPGNTIAVVGLGGVGMAALLVALAQRDCRVIGIDTLADKLDSARALGADDVFTPAQAIDNGVEADIVVEAAGHPRALETAIACTAVGGTTVTVGLPDPQAQITLSPLRLTSRAHSLVGSYLGSADPARDIPRYERLWREGRLPVERLISSRIALDDINTAMDRLAGGNEIRQIITFGDDI